MGSQSNSAADSRFNKTQLLAAGDSKGNTPADSKSNTRANLKIKTAVNQTYLYDLAKHQQSIREDLSRQKPAEL